MALNKSILGYYNVVSSVYNQNHTMDKIKIIQDTEVEAVQFGISVPGFNFL